MLINGDIDEVFAAYQSPIGVFRMRLAQDVAQEIDKMAEESVMQALAEMHIDVDKAELLKALSYDRDQYAQGYADGKAATQPKWISVEERMPETDVWVAVWYIDKNGDYFPTVGSYRDGGNGFAYWETDMDCNERAFPPKKITHWMPLPEPPGGGI